MTNRNSNDNWHYRVAICVALIVAFTVAGFGFQHARLDTARDICWVLAVAAFVGIFFAIPDRGY